MIRKLLIAIYEFVYGPPSFQIASVSMLAEPEIIEIDPSHV